MVNAQSVQKNTSETLTTELTKKQEDKDPLTFKAGVKEIPTVRYNPKFKEVGVLGVLELLSIGNSKFHVGAGIFPNYKMSGPSKGKTKNGPSVQVTSQPKRNGSFLTNCHNVEEGFLSYNMKNARNIMYMGWEKGNENMYDVFVGGEIQGSYMYAVQGSGNSEHIYCSLIINDSSNIFYSMYCLNCSYCLGCIGLQNKQFCIFNKQYTKEERHQKSDEIFSQMEKDGSLGKFFPASMNPFYFNDTAAALIEDFTKKEVLADGYLRRDEEITVDIPDWMEVVEIKDLGEYETLPPSEKEAKRHIDPSILKKVIKDEKGNVYRVIKMEYDFLIKHGLPLPRKHWLERLKGHFRIK